MLGVRGGRLAVLLLWLGVVVSLQGFGSAKVACQLSLEGKGSKTGFKSAQLSCTGGTITAAANPVLGPFTHTFSGVQWSQKGACGKKQKACVLTVCRNSSVVFLSARVAKVNTSTSGTVGGLMCFGDDSSLTFVDARFDGNDARPLTGYGDGVTLHIRSSKFINNRASWKEADGGALLLQGGSALVESSTFSGNTASRRGGGIVLQGNSSARFVSTVLQNNTAKSPGALSVEDTASAAIFNTTFAYNSATGDGGAIVLWDNATLHLTSVIIRGNTANYAGGVDVEGNATLHLRETDFMGNVADHSGGALYAGQNGSVLAVSGTFLNNTAQSLHGGGLFADDTSQVLLQHTTFHDNHAVAGWGGAMMINGSAVLNSTQMTVTHNVAEYGAGVCLGGQAEAALADCMFERNVAIKQGGGLYFDGTSVVKVQGSSFQANTADSGGAAGASEDALGAFTGCYIARNKAQSGGGLSLQSSAHMVISNTTLIDNHARQNGGGLEVAGGACMNMSHSRIVNNSAAEYGGGINAYDSARMFLRGHMQGVGNVARYGGFIAVGGSVVTDVEDARLVDNQSRDGGGMLYALNNSVASFRRCLTTGTQQPNSDGAAAYLEGNVTLTLKSCILSDLYARRGAGVAMYGTCSAHIYNTIMHDTAAEDWAGCMFVSNRASVLWVGGSIVGTYANAGGAINAVGNSRITFVGTKFVNATARDDGGGALYIENNATANITDCTFRGCTAVKGGGAVLVKDTAHAHLRGCNLLQCHCTKVGGGALDAFGTAEVTMHDCRLFDNTAVGYGGAIFVDEYARLVADGCEVAQNSCDDSGGGIAGIANSSLVLLNSLLHRNVAPKGGGLALLGAANLSMLGTKVQKNRATSWGGGIILGSANFLSAQIRSAVHHNQAPFDADVSALPANLLLSNTSNVESFVSRLKSDEGLVNVTLLVTGPQGLPSGEVKVHASLGSVVMLTLKTGADGLVTMPVKLRKPPGSYTLQFAVAENEDIPPVEVTVHVVNCSVGDVTVSSGDACQECPFGSYSFDPRNSSCDQCVPNAECPGGAQILPLPGFWHSSPRSHQLHRCFNFEACPGGANNTPARGQPANLAASDYKTIQCSTGYGGNLCSQCQPGYGTVKPFTCKACMKPAVTITLYTLAALVMLVAVRVLSALSLADSGRDATDEAKPVDLVKPLVVYAQWLFVVVNINGVPWPKTLSYPLQALGWFWSSASSNSLGLDCVLPRNIGTPIAVQKVLFGLLMPLAILTVLLCIELLIASHGCIAWGRPTRRRSFNMIDRVASLCTCLIFLFLPTWSHTTFSLFTCVPLDNPTEFPYAAEAVGSWWAQDMSEECYAPGGYHRAWALGIGIPLLLLLCLVLPAGLFTFLLVSKAKGKLSQGNFRKHYGFLYRTWDDRVCWWEAVVVLQTISLVMVGTFGHALGPYFQALVMMAALGLIGVLLLCVKPHTSEAAGTVSLQSIGVLYLTTYSALTFLPHRNITPAPGYTTTMGVVVLVLHIAFVLSTLWKLAHLINWGAACKCLHWVCRKVAAPCCTCRQPVGRSGGLPECQCLDVGALQAWLQREGTAPRCCCRKPLPEEGVGSKRTASERE